MIASIIFLIVLFIFSFALYSNNLTAGRPSKNVLLGVTLPFDVIKDSEVKAIVDKYKKVNSTQLVLWILFSFPILLVSEYPSICLVYMFVYIGILLYTSNKTLVIYNRSLLSLKKKNNWTTGESHIVTIDTEVSRMKKSMPISFLWFVPSMIISIIPLAYSLLTGKEVLSSLIPLPILLILLFLFRLNSSQKTVVYSENTDVNKACNYTQIRLWSICWAGLSAFESIAMSTFAFAINYERPNTLLFIALPVISSIVLLVSMIYTHNKIRTEQNRLLSLEKNPLYMDDDEYWQSGSYNNPKDNRLLVEKRIGYGYTLNMASKKGKFFTFSVLGGVAILVLVLAVALFKLDFSDFSLSVSGNKAVIDAPFYGYSFDISEIEDIAKVDALPSGAKTNGAETGKYSLGNFNVNGYGKSKLYIYKANKPYICIKLKDIYVFINGKTNEETEVYYKLLMSSLGKS